MGLLVNVPIPPRVCAIGENLSVYVGDMAIAENKIEAFAMALRLELLTWIEPTYIKQTHATIASSLRQIGLWRVIGISPSVSKHK